jgi:hypothetical protein
MQKKTFFFEFNVSESKLEFLSRCYIILFMTRIQLASLQTQISSYIYMPLGAKKLRVDLILKMSPPPIFLDPVL